LCGLGSSRDRRDGGRFDPLRNDTGILALTEQCSERNRKAGTPTLRNQAGIIIIIIIIIIINIFV